MPISFSGINYKVYANWNANTDVSYVISIERESVNSITSRSPSSVANDIIIFYLAIGY